VQDDAYLRELAEAARDSGVPIFLRFASEMNGNWVPYHGNPTLYIQKFRLVASAFHRVAPNVALVWCVNDSPEAEIPRYYPGREYVDWVGVNFYSVPFNNGDIHQPAFARNPADSLRYIYATYARYHPIMIGEYAASHESQVDQRARPEFAIDKIGQLYAALPRLYPRVKAIHWFSVDAFKHPIMAPARNNYSLLDDEQIAEHYRQMIASPYFLSHVSVDAPEMAEERITPLHDGVQLRGQVTLSAWVKSYEQRPRVVYYVNGRESRRFALPGDYAWTLDTTLLPNGVATLKIVVLDSRGAVAGTQSVKALIRNGPYRN
jgi:hypothetical protein